MGAMIPLCLLPVGGIRQPLAVSYKVPRFISAVKTPPPRKYGGEEATDGKEQTGYNQSQEMFDAGKKGLIQCKPTISRKYL